MLPLTASIAMLDEHHTNEAAFRATVNTVSTLTVVCIVLLLALYELQDAHGPQSTIDNLIANLAYLVALLLPLLLAVWLANLVVLIWCWPKRLRNGDHRYVAAGTVRRRRLLAYRALIALALLAAAYAYWRYGQHALAVMAASGN